MTALGLRDRTHRSRWFRAMLACAVALLGVAIMLHHGWMGGMDHAAAGASTPGTTQHGHGAHSDPSPAGLHAADDHAAGHAGNSAASTGEASPPGEGHAMTMAMCLAVLASGLLLPVVAFVRRLVSRRPVGTRRQPRRSLRPPSAVLPSIWIPPPRGGPSAQSLLCVVRR